MEFLVLEQLQYLNHKSNQWVIHRIARINTSDIKWKPMINYSFKARVRGKSLAFLKGAKDLNKIELEQKRVV